MNDWSLGSGGLRGAFGNSGAGRLRLYAAQTATNTIAEVHFAPGEVLRRLPTGPAGDGLAGYE